MRMMAGWLILITFAVVVCGEVQVLKLNRGDSVVLPCAYNNSADHVIGLGLYRKWLQPGQVMYLSNFNKPHFSKDEGRIAVKGRPESGLVEVSLSQLQARDSDVYYCVFTLNGIFYRNVTSHTEYFLHVSDVERLHLGTVPSGLAYNLTLLHLQPEDSALYSCELLIPDQPEHSSALGTQLYFVSVQDAVCQCSSYSVLLYTTFAAVGLLLLLLLALFVAYRGKAVPRVNAQPQNAIYEEMIGVRSTNWKKASYHLEETDVALYSNGGVKPENHYE